MNDKKRESLGRIVAHLGFPNTSLLMPIWDMMVSETEAEWVANLPATAPELAARLGQDVEPVAAGLHDLYMRGLTLYFEETPDGPLYVADKAAGRLMDLVLFDARYGAYGETFLNLWRDFYNQELVHTTEQPYGRSFRVVPVLENVDDPRAALPYEQAAELVRGARRVAVQNCPCRTRERACDNPLETCISLNHVADYVVRRGIGRELTTDEALVLLRQFEELGLVHLSENSNQPSVICNCCPCCCGFLRAVTVHGKQFVVEGTRYRARMDETLCTACGTCEDRCHFDAIAVQGGVAVVDGEHCLGCGLCAGSCPTGAITMVTVEAPEFIPISSRSFLDEPRTSATS
jgi:Pyruvate/2-oxoacid:ferredoxin oxidoreductase delta subunit